MSSDPLERALRAVPLRLARPQVAQLRALLALLERDEQAPTTIRAHEEAARLHVADSLVAVELDALSAARRIADIGSGAGFPGLAMAIALPDASIELVESQRRKCQFLERACVAAEVGNASVVCARAEEWAEGLTRNDAVLARALAPQPVVLEYAAPLLRVGGSVIDWRGRREPEEELRANRAAAQLGLTRVEVRRVEPFPGARDRHLHVFEKSERTPERFPRRAGVARRRPLGA